MDSRSRTSSPFCIGTLLDLVAYVLNSVKLVGFWNGMIFYEAMSLNK